MDIIWKISDSDITKVQNFVGENTNAFVEYRISKNIDRKNISVDKNSILKSVIMGLLTSLQSSGPNSKVAKFIRLKPFPLSVENILKANNIEGFLRITLKENGLNRFKNKIPYFFATNYSRLQNSNWEIINDLTNKLDGKATKEIERTIADNIQDSFIGFGPKQSRNILQTLGLTKYEIPIDSRIISWLNEFGFPISLSSAALQDKNYYHFVLDGIQFLCDRAQIYPCILDAAIFSSNDNGEWTAENSIY